MRTIISLTLLLLLSGCMMGSDTSRPDNNLPPVRMTSTTINSVPTTLSPATTLPASPVTTQAPVMHDECAADWDCQDEYRSCYYNCLDGRCIMIQTYAPLPDYPDCPRPPTTTLPGTYVVEVRLDIKDSQGQEIEYRITADDYGSLDNMSIGVMHLRHKFMKSADGELMTEYTAKLLILDKVTKGRKILENITNTGYSPEYRGYRFKIEKLIYSHDPSHKIEYLTTSEWRKLYS
ncbi:hypothetical protein ACFLRF_04655 [Candidatus Altiarchaeota archaeon]